MPRGNPPPNQEGRPIALSGNYGLGFFLFPIRPETLTRHEPSRMAVQQTLGGAWADVFDRGVALIRMEGHTGWHGGAPDAAIPGEVQWQMLRTQGFEGWHAERDAVIQGGGDPASVEMVLTDTLNGFVDLVAPKSFTLRRSKQRPLLMMYTIELLVLQPLAQAAGIVGEIVGAAASALEGAIGGIEAGIADLGGVFG